MFLPFYTFLCKPISGKSCGKRDECARSRSHTRSFSVPGAGLEPAQPLWSQDFKSCVSTIPPSGQILSCSPAVVQSCSRWFSILHSKNLSALRKFVALLLKSCVSDPVPLRREFHHPGKISLAV